MAFIIPYQEPVSYTHLFRPVVDLYVAANVDEASTLAPALKHALFGLMNADILDVYKRQA